MEAVGHHPSTPEITLTQRPMEEPKKSKKALIIGIAFVLLFATGCALVLCAFRSEGENRAAVLSPNEKLGNVSVALTWLIRGPGGDER